MGLRWFLAERLLERDLALSALSTALGVVLAEEWLDPTPPEALGVSDLGPLCEALGCQPGDLLGYLSDDPARLAAHNLSQDWFYQSFLQHRAAQCEEEDTDQTG